MPHSVVRPDSRAYCSAAQPSAQDIMPRPSLHTHAAFSHPDSPMCCAGMNANETAEVAATAATAATAAGTSGPATARQVRIRVDEGYDVGSSHSIVRAIAADNHASPSPPPPPLPPQVGPFSGHHLAGGQAFQDLLLGGTTANAPGESSGCSHHPPHPYPNHPRWRGCRMWRSPCSYRGRHRCGGRRGHR